VKLFEQIIDLFNRQGIPANSNSMPSPNTSLSDSDIRNMTNLQTGGENENFTSLETDQKGEWEYNFSSGGFRWTDEVYKIFGLSKTYVPNFEAVLNYYAPDSKKLFQKAIDKAISKGNPWNLELKINTSKGIQIWVRDTGEPIFNNGQIVMLKGHLQNITKQKKTEFSLQVFTDLVNVSDEAMIVCESSGDIIYANNHAADIYGFTKDEMQSLKFQEIDSIRGETEKWINFINDVKKNGQKIHEYDFRDNNGKIIPIEERSKYSEISGNGYIIIFFQNISERRNKENRIKKNLEKQQNLSNISYLFNTSDEFDFKIKEVLRIAGNYTNVSRAFIFEDMLSGRAVSNTHEWCNIGIDSQKDDLQAIPYTMFPSWTEIVKSQGYIEASELTDLPEDIVSIFKFHQVISIIAFPLTIDSKYYGFIGFSEAKKKRKWEKDEKEYIKTLSVIISNAYEQKITLDSFKKSEQRFKEFTELLPEMVFEMNINGKIIFANSLACEQFGINQEILQKGIIFYSLFIEDDRLRIFENFESKIKGEKIENEKYKVTTVNGIEIPVIVYVNLIMRDNMPTGLRAVLVDISEKILSEKQILSMSQISEESPYPVLRVEKNGVISLCNSKGLGIKTFLEESYDTYLKDLLDVILKTGRNEELEITIADSLFRLIICPSKDKNYLNIFAKDVTQKKIDDEKVMLFEQRLHDISESIIEYIWETDINFRIKFISNKVKSILGYEPEEIIGRPLFSLMPGDEEKRFEKIVKDFYQKGESFINIESKILKKDHTIIKQVFTGMPIFDFDRKIVGFRGTGMDITYLKIFREE